MLPTRTRGIRLPNYNLGPIRQLPTWGVGKVNSTVRTLSVLRRLILRTKPSELLVYGSVPGLNLLGALVSLSVPMMLGPILFGQYALVETFCRYGLALDLGLSTLVDRRLPMLLVTAGPHEQNIFAGNTLWLRLYIGAAVLGIGALVLPLLSIFDVLPFDWVLGMTALTSGVFGMLLNGPTAVERARSHRRRFALLYGSGMMVLTFGRFLGIAAGGVMGCFAVMAIGFGGLTIIFHRGTLHADARPGWAAVLAFFRESVPYFLVLYTYTLLITISRWVVATRSDGIEFGHFAFGSNVGVLIAAVVGGVAQFWYPRLASQCAAGETGAVSRSVLRDLSLLAVGLGFVSAIGILLAPWLIGLIYPKFAASAGLVQITLVSVPAYVTATWLLPLALAIGIRPWVDGVLIHVVALVVLVATTEIGFQWVGLPGASAGLVVSMPVLVGLQLWRLHVRQVMRASDAAALLAVAAAVTAVLGGFVLLV